MNSLEQLFTLFGLEAIVILIFAVCGLLFYCSQLQRRLLRHQKKYPYKVGKNVTSRDIKQFLQKNLTETEKCYKNLVGRKSLNYNLSDPPEAQIMVLRAKFLTAEISVLDNTGNLNEYWAAIQSVISSLVNSMMSAKIAKAKKKINSLKAKIHAKDVRIEKLAAVEQDFMSARRKLKKAKEKISHLSQLNRTLQREGVTEDDLSAVGKELTLLKDEAPQGIDSEYGLVIDLFDNLKKFSSSLERSVAIEEFSSADVACAEFNTARQEALLEESSDMVESELDTLHTVVEEQRQVIKVLKKQLEDNQDSLSAEESADIKQKIGDLENQLSQSETVISMLENELRLLRNELACVKENNSDVKKISSSKELDIFQNEIAEVFNGELGDEISYVVHDKENVIHRITRELRDNKEKLSKIMEKAEAAEQQRKKLKNRLAAVQSIANINGRIVQFCKGVTKFENSMDILDFTVERAQDWGLDVCIAATVKNKRVYRSSKEFISEKDKALIDSDSLKKFTKVGENLVIRTDRIAMLIYDIGNVEAKNKNISDAFVIQLSVADREINQIEKGNQLSAQKVVLNKLLDSSVVAMTNVDKQSHYFVNESKIILNKFITDLNLAIMQSKLDIKQRDDYASVINEARDRFLVLWESYGILDESYMQALEELRKRA